MIKVYGMASCKDCQMVKPQIENNQDFLYFDIGENVKYLKEFLKLRDTLSIFNKIKEEGKAGIPCFVKDDGSVTLNPEDVGLASSNNYCSIEDHLLGKKGC